jgi:hypothetical protein
MRSIRIPYAVLLAARIEVAPRGLEVGRIALCVLMNVNAMLPRGQIFQIHSHIHGPLFAGAQGHCSGVLAIRGVDDGNNRLHPRGAC